MSKEHGESSLTGTASIIPLNPARNSGSRILLLVVVLVLASAAGVSATRIDPAGARDAVNPPAAGGGGANEAAVYFPGQYVNQGTEAAEHIPAF